MAARAQVKFRLKPLANQVMVITGASSGVGLVTARSAARAGACVMLVARNANALAEITTGIVAAGGRAEYRAADVADAGALKRVAADTIDRFGRIDSWVNVAGVAVYAMPSEIPDDEHRRLFDTNYFGVVNGCRAALPELRRKGGALITVASMGADVPSLLMGAYNASKHAVKGYVGAIRMEMVSGSARVSVTLIKPASIDTPIVDHTTSHVPGKARVPAPYDPQVVADTILYAAAHPVREVTVGGAGRLQSLLGTLFPRRADRQAASQARAMVDLSQEQPRPGNLFESVRVGHERSGEREPRTRSFYTSAALRPGRTAAMLTVGIVSIAFILDRSRRTRRSADWTTAARINLTNPRGTFR